MKDSDLNYLLSIANKMDKNTYKNVQFGVNSSHSLYLKNQEIKFIDERSDGKPAKITVFDKQDQRLFTFGYPFYPNNDKISLQITSDKAIAEKHFTRNGFHTIHSKIYNALQVDKAFNETFSENSSRKVVIKPKVSSLAIGVYINVSKNNFKESWESSISDLTPRERRDMSKLDYIVQEILEGFEARATVMQGNLLAVTMRIPPYIIGDGKNSITDLISIKNKTRNKCTFLKKYPIIITKKIEAYLASHNRKVTDIPSNGEAVLLSAVSNTNAGGELLDITDLVSPTIREFALDVVASVPGMYSAGLDIIMKSVDDPNPAILEANVYPMLTIPKYPTYGTKINVSKSIIDSLIAQYQIDRPKAAQYEIEGVDYHLKNLISFSRRKEQFSALNYNLNYF